MKKYVVLSVLVAILISTASGCGGRNTVSHGTGKVVTLRWVSDANPVRKEHIALFEKANPGIKVELDWASADLQKILVQIAGGNAPDLLDMHNLSRFHILAEKGALLDITPYCKKYGMDMKEFWPQTRNWVEHKGKLYAVPDNSADIVLFYNKRAFDEAGIAYPDESWTWQDMLNAGRKLTGKDPKTGRKRFAIVWDSPDILIWQNGGQKFSADGKKCMLNTAAAKEAIRFLYDMRFKYHIMPTRSEMAGLAAAQGWGQGGLNLFSGGSIAMYPCGRWAVIQLRKSKGLDWDIAPLPRGKNKATLFLARSTAISSQCKHPEEAFKFLLFLRDKDYNRLIAHSGDAMPAYMPVARSDMFIKDPDFTGEKNNKLYLSEMAYARNMEVFPDNPNLDIERIEKDEYDLMWDGGKSPEEMLESLTGRINKLLKR